MISRKGSQKITLVSPGGATPQLREDDGRGSDQSCNRSDSFLVAASKQIIDQNRCVKDNELAHSPLLVANLSLPAFFFIRSLKRWSATISRNAT